MIYSGSEDTRRVVRRQIAFVSRRTFTWLIMLTLGSASHRPSPRRYLSCIADAIRGQNNHPTNKKTIHRLPLTTRQSTSTNLLLSIDTTNSMGNITSSEDEDDDVSIQNNYGVVRARRRRHPRRASAPHLEPLSAGAAAATTRSMPKAVAASQAKTKGKAGADDTGARPAKKKRSKQPTWDERYEHLKAFRAKFGHTRVPQNGEWKPLFFWLYRQKKLKNGPHNRQPQLNSEQIEKLDEICIEWKCSRQAQSLDDSFAELEAFYNKNGHCKVPWKTERRLCDWLLNQKKRGRGFRKPELTKEQIEKLKNVGVEL